MRRLALAFLLVVVAAANASAGTGRIIIVNVDEPGVGLNDPTPAAPVGGNEGTTLGQQRLNVFLAAAARWNSMLDTNVDIRVEASFAPLECSTETVVLGAARPTTTRRDFTNAPLPGVWYPIALANKFAGVDLLPSRPDIDMFFNGDVDNSVCMGDSNWYYGFDGNEGIHSDFYVVALHEMAHGLGFSGATAAPGFLENRPSVFDIHTRDLTANLRWDQMSQPLRQVSLTNTGNVVWDGENVRAAVGRYLRPLTTLAVTTPASEYKIGFAEFGPPAATTALAGKFVRAIDAANSEGPTTFDGCSAFTNGDAIRGNIAMIDRGSPAAPAPPCTFVKKVRNAQAAGAIGVLIVDNSRATCIVPEMGGLADDITIPVFSVSANDGDVLKSQLAANAGLNGALRSDPARWAGASNEGYLRLFTPCTDDPGSSLHHWDITAKPNLLMEPSINADLLQGVDLTRLMLLDIGWSLPPKSGRRALIRK